MKLEAIVLAAGAGSRMVELTRGRPKCLLPVGNQSLIWFAITGLKAVGVSRIIVLVSDSQEADIKQYCHKKFNSFKELVLEFVTVPVEADCGTAESILSLKDKIRGDFIVHSCDTIVDSRALTYLINHYRLYDPMLTMLLADDVDYFKSRTVPGRREKEHFMRDIIAVEPIDKFELTSSEGYSANKVVFIHSERDLKQKLKIKNKELALHPSLGVYSRFLDVHVYIFKKQMLDFMECNKDKAVLKGEMIPLLVSKQFSKQNQNTDILEEEEDNMNAITQNSDYELELRQKLENFNPKNVSQSAYFHKLNLPRPSACHGVIVKDLLARRVNTVGSYLDCNKDAKFILNNFALKNINCIKDCAIGENTTVGKKCLIKKGTMGNNCKIGDKVKLIDCVLMDNVEIESDTNLTECIVGSYSKIGTKCNLKSCIIGTKQVIAPGKKADSEVIIDDGYVIDLSDLGEPMSVDADL